MDTINILMLGGKRCGKTTVLASMCNEIGKALAGTDMTMTITNNQTRMDLSRAITNITSKISLFSKPLTRVEVDDNPSDAQKTYSFELKMSSSGKGIPFRIHDIPGEWLTDAHQQQVKNLIHESQVILIAIDTPYLFAKMVTDKGYGIYHEEYNKPMEIANFFKNSLTVNDIKGRLILFVPIKCERYYHLTHTPQLNAFGRDYMQEIVNAVGDGYRDLIHYVKSTPDFITGCTMAITPILSAGGIDFVKFKKDEETGKVVSLYQEGEFLDNEERGYNPKFCEQPLVYSLVFILTKTLRDMNSNSSSGKQMLSNFWNGLNPTDLNNALETLKKKMKKGEGRFAEDGFLIIQDYAGVL